MRTIALTTTDGINSVSTTFDVTLEDTIAPTLTSVSNQTEETDASCNFTIPDYTGLTTASDNCATTLTLNQTPAEGPVVS